MALDTIQPGSVARGEVKPNAVLGCPFLNFGLTMVTYIIQNDIEYAAVSITTSKPTEKAIASRTPKNTAEKNTKKIQKNPPPPRGRDER